MLTKLKLALALSATLVGGAATIAAAQGNGPGFDKKAMMQKYDKNGDGTLDDAERAAMRADFKAKRLEKKAELLAKFDTNKDGKLDKSERAVMKDEMLEKRFARLDANGDGVISKEEFKAAKFERGEGMRHGRHGHRGFRGHGPGARGGAGAPSAPSATSGDIE